jgi:ferritin-like metal-binding protein YciE
MAKQKTLPELFITKIQALYDVESELVKALPKMAKAATDPDLKEAFQDHWEETKFHVKRLEDIFDLLGVKKEKLEVDAIRGLVADGEWCVKHIEPGDALDATLAGAARAVEHYEIASYLSAQAWAELLEDKAIVSLLEDTLEEEIASDEKLEEVGRDVSGRLQNEEEEI